MSFSQEQPRQYRNKEWLKQKYVEEGLFGTEIAEVCGVHSTTIYNWLRKFDIPVQQRGKRPNHVELTDELCEFLDGLLLGDGNIHPRHAGAAYQHRDSNIEYLEWLSDKLREFGLERSGKIYEYEQRGCPDGHYKTKDYIELTEFYQRWYGEEGDKTVPEDISLTPTVLMNWYIGDGSYNPNPRGGLRIGVICENMRKGLPALKEKLENLEIECTICSDGLRVGNSYQDRFFNYILSNGMEIPPCYEYKFPKEVVN